MSIELKFSGQLQKKDNLPFDFKIFGWFIANK